MERKTAADFDPELLILFDAYVHGDIDRRGFLDRAAKFAVGGTTAAMLLDALNPRFADAQQVRPDDARLETASVSYPSPDGYETTRGYLARPKAAQGSRTWPRRCPSTAIRRRRRRPPASRCRCSCTWAGEGAQHGFHNDTTPRYDSAAAALAWQRTLDFFARHVKAEG